MLPKSAWSTLVVLTLVCFVGHARSQDKPAPADNAKPAAGAPDMAAMMKKWIATIEPGPEHKALEKLAGSWNLTAKIAMGGPGTEPMSYKATSECRMILDGRYLQEELTGEWFRPDPATGQMKTVPWKGIGLTGYDRFRHMYTSVWIDNQSTALNSMTGMFDPSGKVLTFYGEMDEPMLDVIGRTVKYVHRIESDTKRVFEVYDLHAGDGYKVVEVTYEKK